MLFTILTNILVTQLLNLLAVSLEKQEYATRKPLVSTAKERNTHLDTLNILESTIFISTYCNLFNDYFSKTQNYFITHAIIKLSTQTSEVKTDNSERTMPTLKQIIFFKHIFELAYTSSSICMHSVSISPNLVLHSSMNSSLDENEAMCL